MIGTHYVTQPVYFDRISKYITLSSVFGQRTQLDDVCEVQTLHKGRKMWRSAHIHSFFDSSYMQLFCTVTCQHCHKVSQSREVNNHIALALKVIYVNFVIFYKMCMKFVDINYAGFKLDRMFDKGFPERDFGRREPILLQQVKYFMMHLDHSWINFQVCEVLVTKTPMCFKFTKTLGLSQSDTYYRFLWF